MPDFNIILPSKPKVVKEEENKAVFEIDGFYPGYGHSIGNSLRRIVLSSLPGSAITSLKIDGVDHEFSSLEGVKEDIIMVILNLKKVRFQNVSGEPQKAFIKVKGIGSVTAKDIEVPAGMVVLNPEQPIATLTTKSVLFNAELIVETGLGYIPKEVIQKERVDVGTIALDASFTPVRRVNYEVENMRVADRTDYNRLIIFIETDGTLTPREALERSIEIMISQLKSILGFATEPEEIESELEADKEDLSDDSDDSSEESSKKDGLKEEDVLKMRIEDINFSSRTQKALSEANIRTMGGLGRKTEEELLAISGLGEKGLSEIKKSLADFGISLKD